jgi:heptosyltransferase-2
MATFAGLPVFDAGTDNTYGAFAARLQLCDVVVTSDSLAVHVAAARKTKAVVLFGPTSAAEIELYGRGEKVVPPGMDCLCCYLPSCDVKPHCQARIEPAAVFAAVHRQLAAK